MKTIFILLAAALVSFSAAAQNYNLQTIALGTNAIPATNALTFPLVLSSYTVTNIGAGDYFYLATNSATNTAVTNLTLKTAQKINSP